MGCFYRMPACLAGEDLVIHLGGAKVPFYPYASDKAFGLFLSKGFPLGFFVESFSIYKKREK